MLVLSRKPGEKIQIGAGITLTVLEVTRGKVRLGLDAPKDVPILRGELVTDLNIGEPACPDARQLECVPA